MTRARSYGVIVSSVISWLLCCILIAYGVTQQFIVTSAQTRSSAYFQMLYDSTYPFAMLDPDGLIVEWNKGAEDLFGWSAKEVIGSAPDFMMDPNVACKHRQAIERVQDMDSYKKVKHITCTARTKSGELVGIDATVRAIRDGTGWYSVAFFYRSDAAKPAPLPAPVIDSMPVQPGDSHSHPINPAPPSSSQQRALSRLSLND